ncbi:hypothetical protein LINGRAHAP2_LOCUS342 [Linum grandiflorum]
MKMKMKGVLSQTELGGWGSSGCGHGSSTTKLYVL